MSTQNKPVKKFNDGLLEAAIWKKPTDKGNFYTVTLTNSYQDEHGDFKTSNSFTADELLKLPRLANLAYDEIVQLRQADKASRAA